MTAIQGPDPRHHLGEPPVDPHADDDELSLEQREVAGRSQGQIVRRRFLHHKGAMVSLVGLGLIVVLAVTSIGAGPIPGWWKYDSDTLVPPNRDQSPTMSLLPS